jgi:hypothetical protein
MCKVYLLKFLAPVFILASCSQPTTIPLSSPTNPPKIVIATDYPPLDWSINRQRYSDLGCDENLQESCPGLVALGCDDIERPRFYLGGLQPPYAVMECIHENGELPNSEYFKQPAGLDTRYRSYAIYQEGKFRLIIKKS